MASSVTLHQIVAIEKGAKTAADAASANFYHTIQRTSGLTGIERSYRPKDSEDPDVLPSESTKVQTRVLADVIPAFRDAYARYLDVVATKDFNNGIAKADVMVDGVVILKDVTVPTLLFLEKQCVEFKALVDKLPVFDMATNWNWDANAGLWRSDVTITVRNKKVPKNWVKAEATDKHPAQVEIFHEDVLVGYWDKTEFSGAVSPSEKRALQVKVQKFAEAVRLAREAANSSEVVDRQVGAAVISHIFG